METTGSLVGHFSESSSFLLSGSARTLQCCCWARRTRIAASGIHAKARESFSISYTHAEREHAPNDVVGKVPVRSCRECHQETADHHFVDRQWSRVPRCGLCWISSQQHSHSVDVHFRAFNRTGFTLPILRVGHGGPRGSEHFKTKPRVSWQDVIDFAVSEGLEGMKVAQRLCGESPRSKL